MSISRRGRFLYADDFGVPSALGLESSFLEDCINEIVSQRHLGVWASSAWGFEEPNLDALTTLTHVELAWFWDVALRDITGLYALPHLKSFRIDGAHAPIDFSRLAELRTLIWRYSHRDSSLEKCQKLTDFYIWHYKPKSKSWADLSLPTNLEKLEIYWANPAHLMHFPFLGSLKVLEFHRCRNLASLEGIAECVPRLERLVVTASGRLKPSAQMRMPGLKTALVNGVDILSSG